MKSASIRLVVVLATLSILGITITQLYWVRRAFNLKEAEFERTVSTALFNVAQQIFDINKTPSPANNPVRQLSTNYFVVMVNSEIDASLLEFLLKSEFEKRNIHADFEYGIYDCKDEKMVYGDYVSGKSSSKEPVKKNLPKWLTQGYHFGVQFPYREANILNQMGIWMFSSVVLLLVIIFFCYTLFVILKQRRLSEVQKDFINNMAHEFKTPIATIAVSTEVLKDPAIFQQPQRLQNYTAIIESENNRLKQQVERVLQIAQFEHATIGFNKEAIDIHQIIKEAIDNASLSLSKTKGSIHHEFQATHSVVMADRLHLLNVFHNLIDNAIKYCKNEPLIDIKTYNDKGIVIVVHDNGIGIKHEDTKRIFQKFYRVSTGNVHDVKGFGLGLSYVKKIIDVHQGKIKVESEIENGSTFIIHLPFV